MLGVPLLREGAPTDSTSVCSTDLRLFVGLTSTAMMVVAGTSSRSTSTLFGVCAA
jgi:hypothetical protein